MNRLRHALLADSDGLSLTWRTRYVHTFFRNWESVGREDHKDHVPSQLIHSAALSYVIGRPEHGQVAVSAELQNLGDGRAYDFFGVQLAGRAAYFKLTLVH